MTEHPTYTIAAHIVLALKKKPTATSECSGGNIYNDLPQRDLFALHRSLVAVISACTAHISPHWARGELTPALAWLICDSYEATAATRLQIIH